MAVPVPGRAVPVTTGSPPGPGAVDSAAAALDLRDQGLVALDAGVPRSALDLVTAAAVARQARYSEAAALAARAQQVLAARLPPGHSHRIAASDAVTQLRRPPCPA